MKRIRPLGLVGLVATVAVLTAPFTVTSAIAQSFSILEELELTEDQKTQLQANFEERRAEINEILTDEQREQFQETYQESQDFRTAASAVDDLTEDQKESLQDVFQTTRQNLSEVLTEEQLSDLRSIMQERRRNRR